MIIHNKFIFAHLTKTGGTFIRQYLRGHIQGALIQIFDKPVPKHGNLADLPKIFLDSRFKFGAVRSPLSFYISLWASNITPKAVQNRPNRKKWFKDKEVKNDPMRFIRFLNDEEKENVNLYNFPLMHKLDIGVLTYRYLMIYYDHEIFKDRKWEKNHKDYKLVDEIMIFERDLSRQLDSIFRKYIFPLEPKQVTALRKFPPKNLSKHEHYLSYYNNEMMNYVKHKDRFIFKLHYPMELK